MTETHNDYMAFAEPNFRVPHMIRGYLPSWSPAPDPDDTKNRLLNLLPDVGDIEPKPGEPWRIRAGDFEVSLNQSAPLDDIHFIGSGLENSDIEAVRASELSVSVETTLGQHVLNDFHLSLRLLFATAPETIALHDVPACRVHPQAWLRGAAESSVPPPPTALFSVHGVADSEARTVWLHSHGLRRCGSIELEILECPREHSGLMCSALLNVAATMFIEQGVLAPDQPFFVGQDLDLIWLPWEEALERTSFLEAGGRKDRDPEHSQTSGVLFAPPIKRLGIFKGRPRHPSAHLKTLQTTPLLYHSEMETQRMSLLAKDQFPTLRKLVTQFVEDEDWEFLVKLGYATNDQDTTEHLWFRIHGIDQGEIDATLLNQPYGIERLNASDRGRHAPDLISDWMVNTPHGSFEAHRIQELIAKLEDDGMSG